jgi:hypothetical protein
MKLRDAATWLPNHLDRARLGQVVGPTLVQLRRAGGEIGRLNGSLRRRYDALGGRSARPRGLHDDVFAVPRTSPCRCASTTCSSTTPGSHHRLDLRSVPRSGALARGMSVAMAVAGCGEPPTGWRRGPSRASTHCYQQRLPRRRGGGWFRARGRPVLDPRRSRQSDSASRLSGSVTARGSRTARRSASPRSRSRCRRCRVAPDVDGNAPPAGTSLSFIRRAGAPRIMLESLHPPAASPPWWNCARSASRVHRPDPAVPTTQWGRRGRRGR